MSKEAGNGTYTEIEKVKKLCEPLVEYLKQNQDPHTEIVVSMDFVKMKKEVFSVPNDAPEIDNEVLSKIIRKRSYKNRPLSDEELSFLIACKEILSDIKD